MVKRMIKIRSLLLFVAVAMLLIFADTVMAEDTSEKTEEETYITFYPDKIPVYNNYETGVAPMTVEDYSTGLITTYKRLDMFNPKIIQGYTVLNTGIKYFSEDNNSVDANQLGLKRVVYCMEYAKASPNEGNNFSYTYSNTNVYRPEVYIMANGVRYLNQECVNEKFRTGYGADYDYYVTQMAIHLARGEFTYDYFKERMMSLNSGVSETVKTRILECIYNLYAHGVNITTDSCMLYLYGSDNVNSILMNDKGSTHYLSNVENTWAQDTNGNWITPTAQPVSQDYYGGDLRPYYRDMKVTTDVSGVNIYQYSLHGGTISQGFYLYCSEERYKELQLTGATITVTCELTLPNAFAGRVLDFSINNTYQDVEYYGSLTEWGNNKAIVKAKYTIPKMVTYGQVYIQKTSAYEMVTSGNESYNLSGAEYTIYTNEECTNQKGVLTTNKAGKSNILELDTGIYYIKETKAPPGYLLDDTVYEIALTTDYASRPYVLEVTDEPLAYPMELLLKKVDGETLESKPQGTGTLEGAEFTVKYYDICCEEDPQVSGYEAKRNWVFRTDANGYIYFNDASYFVKGDPLFTYESDKVCIPIGTITIQESKPSEGYLLNDIVYVVPITTDMMNTSENTYVIPEIPENIFKLNLRKRQEDTDISIAQVHFLHTRPNGETETFVTDGNGEVNILGLEKGVHIIEEILAPEGYLLNANIIKFAVLDDNSIQIESETVESNENSSITIVVNEKNNVEVTVEDRVAPYSMQICKLNNKGMVLAGAEFTLYEDEKCQVILDTKTTDEEGKFTIENLIVGKTYYMRETKAPIGYKLSETQETIKICAEVCPANNIYRYYINDEVYSPKDTDMQNDIYISGNANDRIVHLKVENTLGTILPETGSKDTWMIILIGIILTCFSIIPNKKYAERNRYNYEK